MDSILLAIWIVIIMCIVLFSKEEYVEPVLILMAIIGVAVSFIAKL